MATEAIVTPVMLESTVCAVCGTLPVSFWSS